MAQNNIEVEIKTKLTKSKFDEIKKLLHKNSKFIKSSHHVDDYYIPKHRNFLKPKYPYEWLSVRTRNGKTLLNYKCWHPKGKEYTKYCDEFETEIVDKGQLEKILKVLDVKRVISVDKQRLTYTYKNKFEIALDEVKTLGYFIEVEALKHKRDINKTHEELINFAKSLGVKRFINIPGGYAAEILRKKKLLK